MRYDDPRAAEAMRELLLMIVAGVRVVTQLPKEMPDTLIRIERVGGKPDNAVTDGGRFMVQVYARTDVEAGRLAGDILAALNDRFWRGTRTGRGHMLRGWAHESMMSLADPDRPGFARWQIMGRLQLSMLRPD